MAMPMPRAWLVAGLWPLPGFGFDDLLTFGVLAKSNDIALVERFSLCRE